jgi:ElaB/YqjD/DUF883 family membrane-anchored ribosome-binding protein
MHRAVENIMADQIIQTDTRDGRPSESLKSFSEQAMSAGRDLRDRASDLAGASADTLKAHASDFVDAAKDVASQAADKLKENVSERKGAGADYVGNLADTIRRAAREFDTDLPIAGSYMRKAASQVESVSDSIRTGEFNDVVRHAQDFARRQPTAFLGLATLAGFAVVRFLKSSSDNSHPRSSSDAGRSPTSDPDAMGYRDDFSK